MGKWKPLSLEERKIIEKELKNGTAGNVIARILGRSNSAVHTDVRINGGAARYSAEEAQKNAGKRQYLRTASEYGAWTDEEVQQLKEYFHAGYAVRKISKLIGRPRSQAHKIIHELGLARDPPTLISLATKIENIELQLEIILETLEEMKNE